MPFDIDAFLDEPTTPTKPVEADSFDVDAFLDEGAPPRTERPGPEDVETFLEAPPREYGEARATELPWFEQYLINPLREGYTKGKQQTSILLRELGVTTSLTELSLDLKQF